MAKRKYLFVNTAVLFGTREFEVLRVVANIHRDAFKGIGYFQGKGLDQVYAVFAFDDLERLDAVKWLFERLYERIGYRTKNLIQVRSNFPENFKLVGRGA